MPRFSSFDRLLRCAAIVAAGWPTISSCAPGLVLDKLSDCVNLAEMRAALLGAMPTSCRPPIGEIGRALHELMKPAGVPACFLGRSTGSTLQGFDCLRYGAGQGAIVCYRPAPLSVVDDYKENFADYAAPVQAYLERARRCPVSSGSASIAPPTLLPPVLSPISAYEFGYINNLGPHSRADGAAVHGFARTSPELSSLGVSAIEFVNVYQGDAVPSNPKPLEHVGAWLVDAGDESDFADEVEKFYRRAGLRTRVKALQIAIQRGESAPAYVASGSLTRRLERDLAAGLEDEEFESMDKQFAEKFHLGGSDPTEFMLKNLPFGQRSAVGRLGSHPSASVFMKTSGPGCTSNGQGAMGALIMRFDGVEGVKFDYGSVALITFGVGACSRATGPSDAYLSGLVDDARDTVLRELRR